MTSIMSLSQFKVLIFDVYGTLIDWETGIYNALTPLLADSDHHWSKSDVLLAFSSIESDLQSKNPTALYSDILATAYDQLSRRLRNRGQPGVVLPEAPSGKSTTTQLLRHPDGNDNTTGHRHGSPTTTAPATAFAASLAHWPIFPDTINALVKLSSTLGLDLVVLSNVDRASFAHTRVALERGFAFSAIFTAEEIGSYKPDTRNFEYAVTQLQAHDPSLERDQILVVAQSLPHDHVPARNLGLTSAWIDRPDAVTCLDGDGVPKSRTAKETFAKWRFESLGEFASEIEKARDKQS
ncbi:HAD-like domain-containing protein [Lactifluus volemus]|nr:HAD-like domain-containing protein [Lactifluus volemus]